MKAAYDTLVAFLLSGGLWQIFLLIGVLLALRTVYRVQKNNSNVDWYDLIRDHTLPGKPLSRVGTFYMMGAVTITAVYVWACTRPGATIEQINIFTITFGGLAIASQAINKYGDRPPAPAAPPSAPQNQINVGNQP